MTNIKSEILLIARNLMLIGLTFQFLHSTAQVKEPSVYEKIENVNSKPQHTIAQITTFPQIHTNLNGMVREFVRTMHQDKNGNYWFGTNGDGIIRYDGQTLEKITIAGINPHFRVLEIVEDKAGNLWFGTSVGLIKYDGKEFATFSKKVGLQNEEIWGLTIDKSGIIWVGATEGVSQFDGKKFVPFALPDSMVEDPKPMLSHQLIFKMIEDKHGTMWFVFDGNGIFKYKNGDFLHLTADKELADNNVADILEDSQGNIWIGTFYGGVSKFDGKTFTNYTKDGIIEGVETYNFFEDRKGHLWFSAEGYGVYRYDGVNFTQFTTENGLTTNVVQSIFEDNKGQLWFGTWQGMCIFDGEKFVNAKDIESWTN